MLIDNKQKWQWKIRYWWNEEILIIYENSSTQAYYIDQVVAPVATLYISINESQIKSIPKIPGIRRNPAFNVKLLPTAFLESIVIVDTSTVKIE